MITKTKRVLLLSLIAVVLPSSLLWATGGNAITAVSAALYTLWWCTTVPSYYRRTAEVHPVTPDFVSKVNSGMMLAIPVMGVLIYSLVFLAVALFQMKVSGLAHEVWVALIIGLPFSTATAIAYIGYELNDIAEPGDKGTQTN